jgi:hypothetical protein
MDDGFAYGVALRLAEEGLRPSDLGIEKAAQLQVLQGIGSDAARMMLATALVTGIPVGVLMHAADKKSKKNTTEEENLKRQIDSYRDAAGSLEGEMARQGISV